MSSRTLNWSRTAKSSLVKQHLVRPSDPIAARPALNVRTQQIAEFSGSSENRDRLGHRAKKNLLDREFFLSLLNSASTKREAKSYLARLKASPAKYHTTLTDGKTGRPRCSPSTPGLDRSQGHLPMGMLRRQIGPENTTRGGAETASNVK
ncbi:unnamed protein product [Penicillium roqueforti FM164]|uniref:Genomic scaffold, ProqFM164S02 n=1 Tax=Penicillium roqueforti (strain FM164) TaxID=1365484 RepID=W6Q9B6_PENRF|nr:unnamed protein product [Penicillium roqueforti FM164]